MVVSFLFLNMDDILEQTFVKNTKFGKLPRHLISSYFNEKWNEIIILFYYL